jgi:hypothetical protein
MTAAPSLIDTVSGHLGPGASSRSVVRIPFSERSDTFTPHDRAGQLGDLGVVAGIVAPVVAEGWADLGRDFVAASGNGFTAADVAGVTTLLTRDATVRALVSLRDSAAAWPRALYVRGLGTGGTECISLGLLVGKPAALELRLYWEDASGTRISSATGAALPSPASDDDFLLLTATRRWVSVDEVVVRYFVGGELLLEQTLGAGAGDIAGDTTAHTSIGASKSGGAWGQFWDGVIDEIEVLDYEMSPEEVRATWERLTQHQPDGCDAFAALAPPGSKWGADHSTRIGRLARMVGEGFGLATARAEELRENFLPSRAYLEWLPRWENLVAVRPGTRDWLDRRRQRVVALLSRDNGYSPPKLQESLSEPFDLAAADVEIVEFDNRWTDGFATLERERWFLEPDDGTWSVAGGQLSIDTSAGGAARYGDGSYFERNMVVTPLSSGRGRLVAGAKVVSYAGALPTNVTAGLLLRNDRSHSALWFGVSNRGAGVEKVGYISCVNGVAGAFVAIATTSVEPLWLRIIRAPATRDRDDSASDTYRLSYSTTGPSAGFVDTDVAGLLVDPEWAGFGIYSPGTFAAGSDGASFDDFFACEPQGTRPFVWYAYRDPGLAGAPDMVGADDFVRRLRPAYTHAAAITSKSLLCDDPFDGRCDRGPMGAL